VGYRYFEGGMASRRKFIRRIRLGVIKGLGPLRKPLKRVKGLDYLPFRKITRRFPRVVKLGGWFG